MVGNEMGRKIKVVAKILTVIVAILIFFSVGNLASAADINLGKSSDKSSYQIGEVATYSLRACNPSDIYSMTLDIFDEFPDGNNFLQFNGVKLEDDVVLSPNECWTDTVTYVVQEDGVTPEGHIWNWLYVQGENSIQEPVTAAVSNVVPVTTPPPELPLIPIPCCETCGSKVEQGGNETVYVLRPVQARIAYHDANSDGNFDMNDTLYVDMVSDDVGPWVVESGDVRLTAHHSIPPNTKVVSNDADHGYVLKEIPAGSGGLGGQAVIGFVDVNANGVYDLADPLYVDTDSSSTVTVKDVRLTERSVMGQTYDAFTKVQIGDLDVTNDLKDPVTISTTLETRAEMLLGYIDSDCSADWSCPDKLYLQQITGSDVADNVVSIGDLRLYIPQDAIDDEGWPPCSTKVEQGDVDAVYTLTTVDTQILWYEAAEAIYLDMDESGTVTQDDIRLTWYHDLYPPNTKVFSTENDKNNPLVTMACGQTCVGFVDVNGNGNYDLADPLYVDVDGSSDVTVGDLRLTDRTIQNVNYSAFTRVGMNDWDGIFNEDLKDLVSGNTVINTPVEDLLGFIDTDCDMGWSCPDKLYLQQITGQGIADDVVSIGDLRLYIPQDAIDDEGWPACGSKVELCDIDNTYSLRGNEFLIGFGDANSDNVFNPENGEAVYVNMVPSSPDVIEAGDVRLSWYHDLYPPNSKVMSLDIDKTVEFATFTNGQNVIGFVDTGNDGTYDIGDPLYVDTDGSSTVTKNDLRITPRTAMGVTYEAYTIVESGDNDLIGDKDLKDPVTGGTNLVTAFNELVRYLDTDCSGYWTCPDGLYLQQLWSGPIQCTTDDSNTCDRIIQANWVADWAVTIGDFRLYWPPCDGGSCTEPCCVFDADNSGTIELNEAVAAITAYFNNEVDLGSVVEVINCYFG